MTGSDQTLPDAVTLFSEHWHAPQLPLATLVSETCIRLSPEKDSTHEITKR